MNKLRLLVFAGLIVYAAFFLIQSCLIITYPYQVSYPEGLILNQAALLSRGENIYKSINDYPFIVVNYPPVYLLLNAGLFKLFKVSFAPGRLITFLATISVCILIYKILLKKTKKEVAVISALLFISSSYIFKDNPFMRVDMLGLLFTLLGVRIFLDIEHRYNIIYAIGFFILALYTKPTFVSAPLAVAIYLLATNHKKAMVFILTMAIVYSLTFFIINNLTSGEFFRHNVLYNLNIFDIKQAAKYYSRFLQTHALLFFFSLVYIFDGVQNRESIIWITYFIVSAVITISVGKIGAGSNYFFELIALNCILTGLSIERFKDYIDAKKYTLFINGVLLAQLVLFIHAPFLNEPAIIQTRRQDFQKLAQIISNTDGDIISEDAGMLVLNKKEVLFQPFEFTQLAHQKIWNQKKFVDDLASCRFSLLILSFDVHCFYDRERLTPEMVEAIKKSYYIVDKIGDYYLYHPIFDKQND
ncbi:MAG: glycosyltransferase family 39 protein [candidate division WOR-3 bacterium]|nr:glycosyltransferase family 39 protein [candidate division WOR-3 bacterium]